MKILLVLIFGFSVLVTSTPIKHNVNPTKTSSNLNKKEVTTENDAVAEASSDYDDGEAFLEPQSSFRHPSIPHDGREIQDHSIELEGGSQTFFPSFADLFNSRNQPLGHSRPIPSFNQEGAYSQRPNALRQLLNYQAPSYNGFRSNDYGKSIAAPSADANGILGSGNFGVIRGGTFFSDSSDTESQYSDSYDNSYFNNNNGHGRPTFYFGNNNNNNPRPNYNQEQFANFRDFADINAPSSSAFSHFVVVYANRNATLADVQSGKSVEISDEGHLSASPKNIIERLAQIDEEQQTALPTAKPEKKVKISNSKAKLALLNEKKHLKKTYNKKKLTTTKIDSKDLVDPLLALS